MKRSPRTRKTPINLSESISRQLNMYAIAAAAAGVGTLALTSAAQAKIIYTPSHVVLEPLSNKRYSLDLNHDGIKDFVIDHHHDSTSRWGTSTLGAVSYRTQSQGSNLIVVARRGYPSALSAGKQVGPGKAFGIGGVMVAAQSPSSAVTGYWGNSYRGVNNRYLGFKFLVKGKVHYGWARMNVVLKKGGQGQGYSIKGVLTGYAYETVPNKPIIAGKIKGPDVITLQPASLGHLAAGAASIPAWRSEK
jgi:hypothetical protein